MRIPNLPTLMLLLVVLASVAHAETASPIAWPDSPPARHAAGWFAAYASDEAAQSAFWSQHGSPAALAQRPVAPRVQVMRRIRAERGALTPVRVVETGADFCEVLASCERGGAVRIRFMCDADAAHGLMALQIEDADEEGGAPPPAPAEPSGPPPTDAELAGTAKALTDSLVSLGLFSGVVRLERDGAVLYERAAGMSARLPQRQANTLETRFNLGSVNKLVTHVAIEQLAQAGKLKLDDPVTRWLTDYRVENASQVTLRMLLDHRGGVPDMFASPDYAARAAKLRTMADWYALVRPMPLRFAPGSKQAYSNGGFILLGMVVEKASGEDYFEYVRRHVYEPAGMSHTAHVALEQLGSGEATGFTRDTDRPADHEGDGTPPGFVPNAESLPARGSSAGGGYSTAADLAAFARALRTGALLDAAHVRDVFGEHFALAVAGGSPGVNAAFAVAGPYTLVVLANLDPPAAEELAMPVVRMMRRAAGLPTPQAPVGSAPGR